MDDRFAQVKLVSWIQNFGKSKSDVEINFIANTLGIMIIAIQEVVAGSGGTQAVVN
jgi:hypothetical protein